MPNSSVPTRLTLLCVGPIKDIRASHNDELRLVAFTDGERATKWQRGIAGLPCVEQCSGTQVLGHPLLRSTD